MTDLDQNALDQSAMARANEVEIAVYNSRSTECVDHHATAENIAAAITAAVEEEREKVVWFMLEHSIATGHGDTIEDLLAELGGYLESLRSRSSQGEK